MGATSDFMKKAFQALVDRGVIKEDILTPSSVTDDMIRQFEERMEVKLPEELKDYLKAYCHPISALQAPMPLDVMDEPEIMHGIGQLTWDEVVKLEEEDQAQLEKVWSEVLMVPEYEPLDDLVKRMEGFRFLADVVENPKLDREALKHFIPVGDWMNAGPICIDTKKKKEDVDYDDPDTWQLRFFDHEEFVWDEEGYIDEDGSVIGGPLFPDFETFIKLYFYGIYDQSYEKKDEDEGEQQEKKNQDKNRPDKLLWTVVKQPSDILAYWEYGENVYHDNTVLGYEMVYETICSGNGRIDGLVSLPIDDIVKRFQTEFAEWSMTETFPDSVFWSHLVKPLRRYDNLDGDSNKLETNKAETRDANSTGAGHGDVHIYHFQYEWSSFYLITKEQAVMILFGYSMEDQDQNQVKAIMEDFGYPYYDPYKKIRYDEWNQYCEEVDKEEDLYWDKEEFQKVIDCIEAVPEERRSRVLMNVLIAAYNNIDDYNTAIRIAEEHKEWLCRVRPAGWYYKVVYAYIWKEEYENALRYIELGEKACRADWTNKNYRADMEDFRKMREDCLRKLEKQKLAKQMDQVTDSFDYQKFNKDVLAYLNQSLNRLIHDEKAKDIYILSVSVTDDLRSVGITANTEHYLEEKCKDSKEDYYYYKYCEDEWEYFDRADEISDYMQAYVKGQKEQFYNTQDHTFREPFYEHEKKLMDSCVKALVEFHFYIRTKYPKLLLTYAMGDALEAEERIQLFAKLNENRLIKEYTEHIEEFC